MDGDLGLIMASKVAAVVVNVMRNGLEVCSENLPGVTTMELGRELVADLVVVDQGKLEQVVEGWVKARQLTAGPLVMVLSSEVCFEHEWEKLERHELDKAIQRFLEEVPVESVGWKVFETEKGFRLVAINRGLYEAVRKAFERLGFGVVAVVPAFVLSAMGIGAQLSSQACRLIVRQLASVAAQGFELETSRPETLATQRRRFLNANGLWVAVFCGVSLTLLGLVSWWLFRRPGQ